MKKIIRDERGSGSITLIIAVIILMFIFLYTSEDIVMGMNALKVENAKIKGLDAMQTTGGLTAAIESELIDYLTNQGFESGNITINGTIASVQWGEEIGLEVLVDDTVYSYQRTGLLSFSKVEEVVTYNAEGFTTSYYYDNN